MDNKDRDVRKPKLQISKVNSLIVINFKMQLSLLDECCCKGYSDRAIYLIEHVKQDLVKPRHLISALKFNYQ